MDFLDFSKPLRELRLMKAQPAYRFVLVWILVAARLGLQWIALPIGGTMVIIKIFEAWIK